MTFEQIWNALKSKQPKIEDEAATLEFTAGNLRALLRQVYDQGHAEGKKSISDTASDFGFGDFLGGFRK